MWQTQESGKYISLDHQTSLGVNGTGISLSEYYSKYADSEGSNINGGTKGSDPGHTKPVQSGTTDAGTTTTTGTTPETVTGDINKDGVCNMKDLILLLQFLTGNKIDSKSNDFQAGDVNGDGILNGMDLALYRQVLSNVLNEFPKK